MGDFLEWMRDTERKWQEAWRGARAFEASPEPGREKFFITVPYPYSNGPLHIGHGRAYTIGDVIARYWRLRGRNVLFPMAFHITGTPILAFSERIAMGDERVISDYRHYIQLYEGEGADVDSILEGFKDPLTLATYFAGKMMADFDALGYSIDWRRRFHTGEPIYNAFVEWQYMKLRELGLITRGDHYVTYCLLHRQPEGEDDIQDADVNPVEIVEYTAILFRLRGTDEYMVASTLRPETLFGATNMWVRPEAEHVLVRFRGRKIYLTKEALVKLQHQHPEEEIEVLREGIPGREFLGRRVETPVGEVIPVLPARFVDPDVATGIVYSEPSDAPYDLAALWDLERDPSILVEYGLDPSIMREVRIRKIIEVPGVEGHHAEAVMREMGIESQDDPRLGEATELVYKQQYYNGVLRVPDGRFDGMPVREAKEAVRDWLVSEGMAFIFYELNRKAFCRSGGKIIVAKIRGQWFIDYSVPWWKERTRELVMSMSILPEKYRKAFLDVIDWLERRPCARLRGLGTRFPFDRRWVIESLSDSTIYMAFYTIAHIIRREGIGKESLIPEVFDYVFLGKGDPGEVSGKSGIPTRILEEMRGEFAYWYPVDLRNTGTPHISNHLSFFLFHHTAIFPREHWPRAISLLEVLIREGAKMSKSKGNVILLRDIAEKYSADLFRFYIAFAANPDSVLDWREEEVARARRILAKVKEYIEGSLGASGSVDEHMLKWFISRFYGHVRRAEEAFQGLRLRNFAFELIKGVLDDLDYMSERRSREEALAALGHVLEDWLRVMSPIIPHMAEEFWHRMGREGFVSLDRWPEGYEDRIDPGAEAMEEAVRSLEEDLKNLLRVVKPVPSEARIIVAARWKREMLKRILGGEGPEAAAKEQPEERRALAFRIASLIRKRKYEPPPAIPDQDEEVNLLSGAAEYLSRRTGLRISIEREEESGHERAKNALPLKPAIFLS